MKQNSKTESVNATNNVASVEPISIVLIGMLNQHPTEVWDDEENVSFVYDTSEDASIIRKCLKKLKYKVVDCYENQFDEDTKVLETNMPSEVYRLLTSKFDEFNKKVYDYSYNRVIEQVKKSIDGDGKCLITFMGRDERKSLLVDTLGNIEELFEFSNRDIRDCIWVHIQYIEDKAYTDCIDYSAYEKDIYYIYDEVKSFIVNFDKNREYEV